MLQPKIKSISLGIKKQEIATDLMVAPSKTIFDNTKDALTSFINDNKIIINSDEIRVTEARSVEKDGKTYNFDEVASTYIQGEGYLSFAANGTFFVKKIVNGGSNVTTRLAHYDVNKNLVIENQEKIAQLATPQQA